MNQECKLRCDNVYYHEDKLPLLELIIPKFVTLKEKSIYKLMS